MEQTEKLKKLIKGLRGKRTRRQMAQLCEMPTTGSWAGLETYGNPQLLTLIKISKGCNVGFEIKNGKISLK